MERPLPPSLDPQDPPARPNQPAYRLWQLWQQGQRPEVRDFLAPLLLSLHFDHPREVFSAFSRVRGHEMAKAALEMAVWDLYARL